MKILGVTFRNNLSATPHVEEIIGACSGSLHALRILRSHGLSREALNVVAEATTISRLLYAAPAWGGGYVTAADRQRLERLLLSKTARLGYICEGGATMEMRVGLTEDRLLKAIEGNRDHVLRRLFPSPIQPKYAHGFELPCKDDKHFIPRVLYKLTIIQANNKI